jgi:hypothetical protein
MDGFGMFDQVSILKPSPVNESFGASANLVPLTFQEKALNIKTAFSGVLPEPVWGDHSRVSHHISVERIPWWRRQIIGAFSTVRVLIESDYLRESLAAILEANSEPQMQGNAVRVSVAIGRGNFDQKPGALGVNYGSSVEECGLGAVLGGISAVFGGFRSDLPILGFLRGKDDHTVSFFRRLLYLRQLILVRLGLSLYSFKGLTGHYDTENAYEDQQASKDDGSTIPPILVKYRNGSKFADNHGFLCICLGRGLTSVRDWFGANAVLDGRRRIGWTLIGLAVTGNVLATASGRIGCLPWSWWGCLHDGQEHSVFARAVHVINLLQDPLRPLNRSGDHRFCPRAGPLLDPYNDSELIELWVRVSLSKSRMYSVHRLLLRAFGENAMEKRTSDYKVIVGDENTINGQLAGDETVWKPIMMNTILDPTKGTTIVVMLEHVQQAVSEGRF